MLAGVVVLDPAEGLGCGIGTDGDGGLAVDGVCGILQFGVTLGTPFTYSYLDSFCSKTFKCKYLKGVKVRPCVGQDHGISFVK